MATVKEIKEEILDLKERLWNANDPASLASLHKKVDLINGRTRENETRSKMNESKLQNKPINLPLDKKWFWILVAIVLLALAGLNVTDLIHFIGT